MNFFSWLFGSKSSSQVVIDLPGPGTFSLPIVGESHYQEALEAICGKRTGKGERGKIVEALLILDDSNPHDNLAVRVEIEGKVVGHLSQEDARQYRTKLKKAGRSRATISCKAKIKGGWERDSGKDRGHYGVWLDLPMDD